MTSEELRKELEHQNHKTGIIIFDSFDDFLRKNGYEGTYLPPYVTDPPRLQYCGIFKNKKLEINFEWYNSALTVWIDREYIPHKSAKGYITTAFNILLTILLLPIIVLTLIGFVHIMEYFLPPNHLYLSTIHHYVNTETHVSTRFIDNNEDQVIKNSKLFFEQHLLDIIRGKKWPKSKRWRLGFSSLQHKPNRSKRLASFE